MMLKGKRVAILLATALPLLALSHVGDQAVPTEEPQDIMQQPLVPQHEDENDSVPLSAIQAIHLDINEQPLTPEGSETGDSATNLVFGDDLTTEKVGDEIQPENTTTSDHKNDKEPSKHDNNSEESQSSSSANGETSKADPQNSNVEEIQSRSDDEASTSGSEERDETKEPSEYESNAVMDETENSTESIGEEQDNNLEDTEKVTSETDDEKSNTVEDYVSTERGESDEEEVTVLDEDEFKLRERVSVDYASKSAGALVIEKSSSFKGTSNLLNGDKDKYAIAACEEKKFVIVSLSEDILVKEIKLANYERFSSTVKDFQVMGSQTMDTWVDLGTYTAEPGNGEQLFELVDPAWARYLKFKFLSYHGDEYYCTYSQIKVHGSTMVQGFHEQWEENEETEILVDTDDDNREEKETRDDRQGTQNETSSNEAFEELSNKESGAESEETRDEKIDGDSDDSEHVADIEPTCSNKDSDSHASTRSIHCYETPNALKEILEGSKGDEDFFYQSHELIPGLISYLPSTSRRSVGRRNGGNRMIVVQQSDIFRQTAKTPFNKESNANDAKFVSSASEISAPKMSDSLEITMTKVLQRFSGANFIPSSLYDEPSNLYVAGNTEVLDKEIPVNKSDISLEENSSEAVVKGDSKEYTEEIIQKDSSSDDKTIKKIEDTTAASAGHDVLVSDGEKIENHVDLPLATDDSLARLLQNLPSAECLGKLDFTDFKAKALRKATSGSGTTNPGGPMEPIFKKLTDEIKSLQTNLSVQDQFTKAAVVCYQRVLFDLMFEMEKLRIGQDERLSRLESELFSSEAFSRRLFQSFSSMLSTIYSIVFAWNSVLLENWIGLWLWFSDGTYRACIVIFQYFTQIWPATKKALISICVGSQYAAKISPILHQVDVLVEEFQSVEKFAADSDLSEHKLNELTVTIPVMPLFAVLVLYTLLSYLKAFFSKPTDTKSRKPTASTMVPQKKKINYPILGKSLAECSRSDDEEDYPKLVDENSPSTKVMHKSPLHKATNYPILGRSLAECSQSEDEEDCPELVDENSPSTKGLQKSPSPKGASYPILGRSLAEFSQSDNEEDCSGLVDERSTLTKVKHTSSSTKVMRC
jgi:hypothetical protein